MNKAQIVFSDGYFERNKLVAESATKDREDALGQMPVGEVYPKFIRGHQDGTSVPQYREGQLNERG